MSSCKKELEIYVFLINILAEHLDLLTPEIYMKLNDSQFLDDYFIPFYDVLHTLGEEYMIHGKTDMMREQGVLT